MNIATWEDENLEAFGDYDAVVFGGRTWTSRSLHDKSRRLAGALVELGLSPGDRVALLLPNGFELILAFTATLRAGGVPVVMYPDSSPSEVDRVLRHCEAKGVIAPPSCFLPESAARGSIPLHIVVGADGPSAGTHAFAHLLEYDKPLLQPVPRDPRDAAQLVYTSGTTGTPKGVVYRHGENRRAFPFQEAEGHHERWCRQARREADGTSCGARPRGKLPLLTAHLEEHHRLSREIRCAAGTGRCRPAPRDFHGARAFDV